MPVPSSTDALPCWSVWRQDDNANAFMIRDGLTKELAQQLAEHYQALGHKQCYWAQDDSAAA